MLTFAMIFTHGNGGRNDKITYSSSKVIPFDDQYLYLIRFNYFKHVIYVNENINTGPCVFQQCCLSNMALPVSKAHGPVFFTLTIYIDYMFKMVKLLSQGLLGLCCLM